MEAQTVGRDDLESPSVEGFFSFVLSYFFYCGCLNLPLSLLEMCSKLVEMPP